MEDELLEFNWRVDYYEVLDVKTYKQYFESESLKEAKEYVRQHKSKHDLVLCKRTNTSKTIKI